MWLSPVAQPRGFGTGIFTGSSDSVVVVGVTCRVWVWFHRLLLYPSRVVAWQCFLSDPKELGLVVVEEHRVRGTLKTGVARQRVGPISLGIAPRSRTIVSKLLLLLLLGLTV